MKKCLTFGDDLKTCKQCITKFTDYKMLGNGPTSEESKTINANRTGFCTVECRTTWDHSTDNRGDKPETGIETPSHYGTGDGRIQTVRKQKMVGDKLEGHLTGNQIHFILTACKYFDRGGEKQYDGMTLEESLEKDMGKAADYFHQALKDIFINELN